MHVHGCCTDTHSATGESGAGETGPHVLMHIHGNCRYMDDATGAGETDLRPACPSLPPPMSISTGVASAVNMTGYDLLQLLDP